MYVDGMSYILTSNGTWLVGYRENADSSENIRTEGSRHPEQDES